MNYSFTLDIAFRGDAKYACLGACVVECLKIHEAVSWYISGELSFKLNWVLNVINL